MKIICKRTELNKALNNVSHSVPVRTTSNILEGILVNVEDNKMKLTSTDTNMTTEQILSIYNVGKSLITNRNSSITINRTYLETYSLPVWTGATTTDITGRKM